jgi:hypothetical protein
LSVGQDADDGNGSSSNNNNSRGVKDTRSVKDLTGRFEQMSQGRSSTPRMSPRPSPSNSIKSLKVRGKKSSETSLARQTSIRSARMASGKEKANE